MPIIVPDTGGGGGGGGGGPAVTPLNDAPTITQSHIIMRIRRWLKDIPIEDTLSGVVGAGATSVSVAHPTQWGSGDVIEVDDDTGSLLHIMTVNTDVDGNTVNPLPVRPGWWGSADTSHANNEYVRKNPRFFWTEINDALRACVTDLWPWGWKVQQTALPAVTGTHLYELPGDFEALIRVSQVKNDGLGDFFYGTSGSGFSVSTQKAVTSVASTKALVLPALFNLNNLNVVYAAQWSFDDVTGDAIPDNLTANALVMGACYKLMTMADVAESGRDQPQNQENNPAGAGLRDAQWFWQQAEDAKRKLNLQMKRNHPLAGQWSR